MNAFAGKTPRRYTVATLVTILSMIMPPATSGGSGGPFTGNLPTPTTVSAATQYILPCPGDVGVNTWNGNLVLPRTDLYLPARGIPLEMQMLYNSQRRGDGPTTYGPGWRMSYHISYEIHPFSGDFIVTWGDGNTSTFPFAGNQPQSPHATPDVTARQYAAGKYKVRLYDGTTFYFDDATHKRITRLEDLNGNALIFTYVGGNLTAVANTAGGSIAFTYDGSNRLAKAADLAGRSVQYQYDANGDQVGFGDTMGVTTTYAYSGTEHLLVGMVDAKGYTTTLGYGAPADLPDVRRVTLVQTALSKRQLGYVEASRTTIVTDTAGAEGRVMTFAYNSLGQLWKITNPLGKTQTYAWDEPSNNLTSYTDRNNRKVKYTYDERGNLLSMTDALTQTTRYTWHPVFNSLLSVTDPLSRTTRYSYDAQGNLIGIVDPQSNQTGLEYDAHGQLVKVTDARGHVTTYEYDAYGRPTRFTNPLSQSGRYEYDAAGNLTGVIGPDGTRMTIAYNAAGQAISSTNPLSYTRVVTYDDLGLVTAYADELGRTTHYAYDAEGQVTTVTDALSGAKHYATDGFGGLAAVTDANDHTKSFGYDKVGRVITETDPLSNTIRYTYDAEGNIRTKTDASGRVITYTYDALNRRVSIAYPDGSQTRLGYDAVGNVITAAGPGYTYTYTYDENNHLTRLQDLALGATITYTYDPNGNRRSMTDPDGGVTYYFCDALDRLERLVNPLGETTTWEYNDRGLMSRVTYPNDTWAELAYDALNRPTELTYYKSDGSAIARYQYTYDGAGNRLTMNEEGYGTTAYIYDALDRLTHAIGPTGTVTYTYDAVGNRITLTDTTGVTTYTYDVADRLLQSTGPGGATQHQYDSGGNLITRTIGVSVTAYTYDYENRLTRVSLPDGSSQVFTYDQSGLRRSRTDAAGTTNYVYDFLTLNLLLERQGSATLARYTTDLDMDGLISQRRGSNSTFYHTDPLGSVMAMSDPAQNVVARYRYDPFGRPTYESGSPVNPFRFTGRPYDAATGLYDVRMRVYDPTTGRFLTPDPVDIPVGPNLYSHRYVYAVNNPVNRVDRQGLFALNPWKVAGAFFNAATAAYDVFVKGGDTTDIIQAAAVSLVVDGIDVLLGGLFPGLGIPGEVKDLAKNLLNQAIDWLRGKRCEIDWIGAINAFIVGLGKQVTKDIYADHLNLGIENIVDNLKALVLGAAQNVAKAHMVPKAPAGPCQKRRQQPPIVQQAPRRRPPPSPTAPLRYQAQGGDQSGRYGGGSTGTADVKELSSDPLRSGYGQSRSHLFRIHNVSNVTQTAYLNVDYYGQCMNNLTYQASTPPLYPAEISCDRSDTYLGLTFDAVPSTTIYVTTTGTIAASYPLTTGQILETEGEIDIDGDRHIIDSPAEVGDPGSNPAPGLVLRKYDKPDPITAGAIQTYRLEAENTGGVGLTNVLVTETYPVQVQYFSATPLPTNGNNRWNLGALAVHEIKTITVTVQVSPTLRHSTVLTNVAQASSDQTPRQTVTETALVQHHPPLAVLKWAQPWPPEPGQRVAYTFLYSNRGAVTMEDVAAVESYDPRMTFISAGPAPKAGSSHIWSLGTLAPGASGQITVVMQVTGTLPYTGALHNEVVFFARQVEPVVASATRPQQIYLPLVLRN